MEGVALTINAGGTKLSSRGVLNRYYRLLGASHHITLEPPQFRTGTWVVLLSEHETEVQIVCPDPATIILPGFGRVDGALLKVNGHKIEIENINGLYWLITSNTPHTEPLREVVSEESQIPVPPHTPSLPIEHVPVQEEATLPEEERDAQEDTQREPRKTGSRPPKRGRTKKPVTS